MSQVNEVVRVIAGMPSDRLIVVVALSALALAAFAIYAVHSIAKGRDDR